MGNIKNYIRKRIQHVSDQNDRLQERLEDMTIEEKLDKLLDLFIDEEITYEQFVNMSTDLQFATYFGDGWFFDELDRRENEFVEEQEYFEKIPVNELDILRPLDITKLSKDYIEKKGLFSEENN